MSRAHMVMAARWVADDGRSWPYDSSDAASVVAARAEITAAVRAGAIVTDTLEGLVFRPVAGEIEISATE